jgi:hypothetical protein
MNRTPLALGGTACCGPACDSILAANEWRVGRRHAVPPKRRSWPQCAPNIWDCGLPMNPVGPRCVAASPRILPPRSSASLPVQGPHAWFIERISIMEPSYLVLPAHLKSGHGRQKPCPTVRLGTAILRASSVDVPNGGTPRHDRGGRKRLRPRLPEGRRRRAVLPGTRHRRAGRRRGKYKDALRA